MDTLILKDDKPLQCGSSIEQDKLSRNFYARSVVAALLQNESPTGLVVSIEGSWGSGKTSTLAMVEDLLNASAMKPVIVHFNPWLIGERDALLKQFFTQIAAELELPDTPAKAEKAADALIEYAKAFELLKYVPDAEPYASAVGSAFTAAGNFLLGWARHKKKSLELLKSEVEVALKNLAKPIIIIIDDIDRLYPTEVFEMIRIVKSVGDLPFLSYVLAVDSNYVAKALGVANIPNPNTYLDKIIQVRLPLPRLSVIAKERLIDDALNSLQAAALEEHFKDQKNRLGYLLSEGLSPLLEQPRDIVRIFNTVAMIEPGLRGEVVLADIIGLAALMIKCQPVFEHIQRSPHHYVGNIAFERRVLTSEEEVIKDSARERKEAVNLCSNPNATWSLIHSLFPLVAQEDKKFSYGSKVENAGRISSPARLSVALQLCLNPQDVSMAMAKRYIDDSESRASIEDSLMLDNCTEFMEALGELISTYPKSYEPKLQDFCLSVASLVDSEVIVARSKMAHAPLNPESTAIIAIKLAVQAIANERAGAQIARHIVKSGKAFTVATDLLSASFHRSSTNPHYPLQAFTNPNVMKELLDSHFQNLIDAIGNRAFFSTRNPGMVLMIFAQLDRPRCADLFKAMLVVDPSLDDFVSHFLALGWDSTNGDYFSIPSDIAVLEAYCPLTELTSRALLRLQTDNELKLPLKAAWRCMAYGKPLYAKDGTVVSR
ncbi:P-loop NTPase fold protein [uncultured Oxalicibacterium sp.]|uniref:KAP family P-loop NTPase fold protein n=1 Tax=uncultured Oxalicibacterium sp. TaxID=1168540 RepID=UPI0025D5B1BC|nr:P-loop NTPase fold protein [uncultured Oxalicibacterium sp.]